jgi:methylenetetrahydrofolate dehydrogenase (NADP+)/methenyltetrahydrofolate cyclohydrolase
LGINSFAHDLPPSCTERRLLNLIAKLNDDDKVHGILVQMPLPAHISEQKVLNAIDPEKDVDGFHPVNVGRLLNGEPGFVPCTPAACIEMLLRNGYDPAGKHVVVLGRSNIVGKPVAALLMQKAMGGNATVTVCHSRTKNLAALTKQADILIAAIGIPEFVKSRMVKDGVIVIDVGINRIPDKTKKSGSRLVGDVDFKNVSKKARAITPVPGGVGPMTIAMLMKNTVEAARRRG